MTNKKTIILNKNAIQQKINRLAYQLYESNYNEKEITLVGIVLNGYILAEKISKKLNEISNIKVNLGKIIINKKNPVNSKVEFPLNQKYSGKNIVIIDDVLNSGRTLIYATKHFLDIPLKKIQILVLINRNHKLFPIAPDFTGLSLSTTMQDHIKVDMSKGKEMAYLI